MQSVHTAFLQRLGRWGTARCLWGQSQVPRVRSNRRDVPHEVKDYGYRFNYHQFGMALPRDPNERKPVLRPLHDTEKRRAWSPEKACFGQNDYIDLLGDGSVHPAQLLYHVPRWLRGFPGRQQATELIRLIHYRNLYKDQMKRNCPRRWHELCKLINYLLQYNNYRKQDELHAERNLGLWHEEPDFDYKSKHRRSYKDEP